MDLKKEVQELNKNLYEHIEPYATGFLKVSDLHTIYWEQSGNPSGHVSFHIYSFLISHFNVCSLYLVLDSLQLLLYVF